MHNIFHWFVDYIYMANGWRLMYTHRNPPTHYLGHIVKGKNPVILIPGITLKWAFMKRLGDTISLTGHPVYVTSDLGHNLQQIPTQAKIIEKIITDNHLTKVTIVAHSKGGLIAKYLLNHSQTSPNIAKVIAIATPFHGSSLVKILPGKHFKELHPNSEIVKNLNAKCDLDSKICTVTPIYDNHVRSPQKGSLESASQNITLNVKGHHRILFDATAISQIVSLLQ